jgi:hypothetical protein
MKHGSRAVCRVDIQRSTLHSGTAKYHRTITRIVSIYKVTGLLLCTPTNGSPRASGLTRLRYLLSNLGLLREDSSTGATWRVDIQSWVLHIGAHHDHRVHFTRDSRRYLGNCLLHVGMCKNMMVLREGRTRVNRDRRDT